MNVYTIQNRNQTVLEVVSSMKKAVHVAKQYVKTCYEDANEEEILVTIKPHNDCAHVIYGNEHIFIEKRRVM